MHADLQLFISLHIWCILAGAFITWHLVHRGCIACEAQDGSSRYHRLLNCKSNWKVCCCREVAQIKGWPAKNGVACR